MIKTKYWALLICIAACFTACKKNEIEDFDHLAQFSKDTAAISAFVKEKGLVGEMHPEYGIWRQIINPGTGNVSYKGTTPIKVTYEGRYLNGNVFDSRLTTPVTINLDGVIAGWQHGIPLIQKGGQIRLIIPSYYGYGNRPNGPIPGNSILDFTITIVDVTP